MKKKKEFYVNLFCQKNLLQFNNFKDLNQVNLDKLMYLLKRNLYLLKV